MNMLYRMTDAVEVVSAGSIDAPVEFGLAIEEDHGQQILDRLLGMLRQDQDASVLEQIDRLRKSQDLVRREIARLAMVKPLDRPALQQLGKSIHGLADQAEVLILAMVRRGDANVLLDLLDEIFDSFRDAERLVEIALRRGRL